MKKSKILLRVGVVALGIVGLLLLGVSIFPIVNYQVFSSQNFPNLLDPEVNGKKEVKKEITLNVDYTKASNWFEGASTREAFASSQVTYYTISIPRLKIENATVAIGGEDLSKSLIHFPGTAYPGKAGNSVIFGHSILPIFFSPKNYISIFSTLSTLRKGDEIFVDYDGISYKYRIETLFEVFPTDIQILDQDYSGSFLTLVTCVPPGDPRRPKRLIVRAKIVPQKEASANIRD
jgi:sortase A